MSYGEIRNKYGKCRSSIQRIVNSYDTPKKKRGPKQVLDKYDKYHIKNDILNYEKGNIRVTSTHILQCLNNKVSRSTVQRTLRSLNIKYKRVFQKYELSKKAKKERLLVARSYVCEKINWSNVAFSDEKMFTLTCNDSYYTWQTKGIHFYKKTNFLRSPGVMVWGVIFPTGFLSLRIISGIINSEKYINILKDCFIPMSKLNLKQDYYFQQDNCRVHTSSSSKQFFDSDGIRVLNWPSYSPDLNIIENVWARLSQLVYSNGPAKNVKELKAKIIDACCVFNETNLDYVQTLYDSIPTRLCDIIEKKGARIKY